MAISHYATEKAGIGKSIKKKPEGNPQIISGATPKEGTPYIVGRGSNVKVYPEGPPKKRSRSDFLRWMRKKLKRQSE